MIRRKLVLLLLAALLLTGAAWFQQRYDSRRDYFAEEETFVSLPSGKMLRVVSFGFQNVTADLLFIWSIQFYSTYTIANRFTYIEHIFDTITDLKEEFFEAYIVGANIMVYEKRDVEMALRLLEKGARNMPQEWLFEHDAGYYCYKYLKDYQRAEHYYNLAAARPSAPYFLKRMRAHMVYLKDDPRVAYAMWMEIYQTAQDSMSRYAAFHHLYQIKWEIDHEALFRAVNLYNLRYRRYPTDLEDLVRSGFLPAIPLDFEGNPYKYNPRTGIIEPNRRYRWKKFS